MTKAKSFRQVRQETADRMGEPDSEDPGDALLPCIRCKAQTRKADLSMFGARCGACYAAFCRLPIEQFNAQLKHGEPTRALPRRQQFVAPGHIGELLAQKPTREQVAAYADELGIDVGDGR